jgi:hypothetical protein
METPFHRLDQHPRQLLHGSKPRHTSSCDSDMRASQVDVPGCIFISANHPGQREFDCGVFKCRPLLLRRL